MNKIMVFLVVFMLAAPMAFAANPYDVGAGGTVTTGSGDKAPSIDIATLSSNVVARIASSADQFSIITKHKNGSKNYASSSESTKIYSTPVASSNEGKTTFEITLSASDTSNFSTWSSL